MQYTLQIYFIGRFLSYPASDPYRWFLNIWEVHENGALNYRWLTGYTPGYVLFCSSMISITDDYYTIFFFLKYLPIFLSAINLLVLFEISRKIFKKKIYVFFTLSIYLSMNYLIYRYHHLLASTMATTLGFLFLLFLNKGSISHKISYELRVRKSSLDNFKKNEVLLRGIVLSTIIMAHPLYGLYYLIFYFFYECYLFIVFLRFNKNIQNSKVLYSSRFLKYIISIFLIIILSLLPWYIEASIYFGYPVIYAYLYYITPLSLFHPFSDILKIGKFFYALAIEILNTPVYTDINNFYINDILKIFKWSGYSHFYLYTMGTGITLIAFGIFLPFNKFFNLNDRQKNSVRFIKFTFIFTFLFYLISNIINFGQIEILGKLNHFFAIYLVRLFELFGGYWAILFVLSFNFIILYFPRLLHKSKYIRKISNDDSINKRLSVAFLMKNLKKLKYIRKTLRNKSIIKISNISFIKKSIRKVKSIKKISKKYYVKKILSVPIIISAIFLSGFYYTINYRRISYYNHFINNSQTSAVLFAGNYFNENPLEKETTILIAEGGLYQIYLLIYMKNLRHTYYSFDASQTNLLNYTDYIELKEYIEMWNVSYVLFCLVFSDGDFQTNLRADIDILYIDEGFWFFGKLK